MRIEPKVVTPTPSATTRESSQPAKTTSGVEGASVVKLSSAGVAASGSTDANHGITAKLATIRTQLATGTYPVDLDRLASRIVDDELLRGPGAKK